MNESGELGRLRSRDRQLQAAASLGFEALSRPAFSALADRAATVTAVAVGAEIVAIEQCQDDRDLILYASVGLSGAVGADKVPGGAGSQAGYTLVAEQPVIADDLPTEVRFTPSPMLQRSGALSSMSIAIGPPEQPWGVLVVATVAHRHFTDDDIVFLQTVSNVLAAALALESAEHAREQALADLAEAQRLARLGSWSWDPVSDQASWSAQMYEIFGRDPTAGPAAGPELFAYIHSDDRDRIAAGYAEAFGRGAGFELDYRIIVGDGPERDIHGLGYADPRRPGCYLGTVQDVSDQRRSERERLELLEASVRSETANRAKSEFLARMSHELRTPLNAIMGFSQLLQIEGLEPRQREHVSTVLKASRHLLELINEVLDLARIEAGRLSISPEPVALVEMIRDAFALLAPLAADLEVTLHLNSDGLADDGHVLADRGRLGQVLLNVFSNSIKYNRRGGQVHVSFEVAPGERVRTVIADSGIGMLPAQLRRLFEPFERLGAELTEVEGTGLGLALSKALIDAMDGTIEVDSQLSVGTTVVIELAGAGRPEPGDDSNSIGQKLPRLQGSVQRQILYIEDNLSNLALVERILENHAGVELIPAMQGGLGLELARQHRPDLIILDLHLPDVQGVEILQRLKADTGTRDIPVIVLTADASTGQSRRVLELGAAHSLTKPIDILEFLQVIADNLPPGDG